MFFGMAHTAMHIFCQTSTDVLDMVKVKQSMDRAWEFQEADAPRFQDSRHIIVDILSALRTGRLYATGNIPGTHFY